MLHVTCALIEQDEKILICQRSASMKLPLKWEFPGGKIEKEESQEDCLKREITEELGIDIIPTQKLSAVPYHYTDFSITLYPFICKLAKGEPSPTEHAEIKWVSKSELLNYDWAAADLPIVEEYLSL